MMRFIKVVFAFILTSLQTAVNVYSQVPTNGLVAYYPFSGNANDASGNGRNGTISGGVTATADRYGNEGQAYSFNGTNGNITVTNWNLLTGNSARTISVWFKTAPKSTQQYFLSWGSTNNATNTGSILGIAADPSVTYHFLGFFGINNDLSLLNADQYFDNRWHLMSFTYDGNIMNLYLDGVSQSTKTNSPLNTGSSNLIIGSYHQNSNYFNGQLDEVRIYNRALTAAEVQQMYISEVVTSVADVIKFGNNKFLHATGTANIFAGINAGTNTTGANNTFLGNTAGIGITSGQGNVFLGSSANGFGANMSTLQRSGAVGYNARVSINDAIVLGDFENTNLKVGIGVHDPQHRLDVKGVINMRAAFNNPSLKINGRDFLGTDEQGEFIVSNFKMKYQSENQWADRVFKKDYALMPLTQLEEYIKTHEHLPGIPTASEVVEKGVSTQEMTAKLLEKVEELTRYVIELKKENEGLKKDYQEVIKRLSVGNK